MSMKCGIGLKEMMNFWIFLSISWNNYDYCNGSIRKDKYQTWDNQSTLKLLYCFSWITLSTFQVRKFSWMGEQMTSNFVKEFSILRKWWEFFRKIPTQNSANRIFIRETFPFEIRIITKRNSSFIYKALLYEKRSFYGNHIEIFKPLLWVSRVFTIKFLCHCLHWICTYRVSS